MIDWGLVLTIVVGVSVSVFVVIIAIVLIQVIVAIVISIAEFVWDVLTGWYDSMKEWHLRPWKLTYHVKCKKCGHIIFSYRARYNKHIYEICEDCQTNQSENMIIPVTDFGICEECGDTAIVLIQSSNDDGRFKLSCANCAKNISGGMRND